MKLAAALLLLTVSLPAFAVEKDAMPPVLGGAVRSEKWVMRKNPPEEEFTGNVTYKNPNYDLKTDWALYNRLDQIIKMRGHVEAVMRRNGEQTRAEAHTAEYRHKTGELWLYPEEGGRVKLRHDDPAHGAWTSLSKTVYAEQKPETALLKGNVRITDGKMNSLSDEARYFNKTAIFRLDGGRPVIWGRFEKYDFAIQGNKAEASKFYNTVTVEGMTEGWISVPEEKEKAAHAATKPEP